MSEAVDRHVSGPSIRVFGGVGVYHGVDPVSIGGPRQRRLLALLAARAGSVLDIDWLAEHLWDDDDRPEATAPPLRTYVSRLRQSLPEDAQDWIETESGGYRLQAPTGAIESHRFTELRAAATQARDREDPLAAEELLDEALALWRGDPFRELEDIDWARTHIEQLNLDRLEMLEERWESALALGRHTQITGELATFTSEHGLRDRAARQYALALHRSGRTPEALRVLENHRRTVAEGTGLDPSPAVVELEKALLAGDPSLDVETVGRPLRGYRLIEEAGIGAFAVVWRGFQPSVDREVAIKQIRSELASQPEFIRRFEAEAHLIARIEHPHIVPLIDFWRDPDSAYLVMRWLPGGTLERRLDDGPLSVAETLVLARQVGDALSAAHAHGVIHRDVKTGNILFDEAGNAFLGDFGIALEATESAGPEAALSPGSPAYSSPEQIRRDRLGPEADVFSLGVVIFECLTGSLPFGALLMPDLVERQLNEPYPVLSELRSDVASSISDAVAKATAKDASGRYGSVAEFLEALEPAPAPALPLAPLTGEVANPYKGLRAFDDGDTDDFFGREQLVSELIARLAGHTIRSRCLVVVGPSGSGKSSVVRAGLVPAIRAGHVDGAAGWFITTMVPGADVFESLEAALLRIAVNPPVTLLDQLRDGDRGILRGVRRCLGSDDDRVLVVIDQFEELFTGARAEDAREFLDAVALAVAEPTSPLRLVLTLRADYYDRPLGHPTFAPVLKDTAVDVTPLAPHELEMAIVEPARRQGLQFEPGLVARIAAETIGQPAPLPLLQYALSELFDRRDGAQLTIEAYDAMGGLSGALAARAEALHVEADDGQRRVLRRVFGRMTNPTGESADLRRRVPLADLGDDPSTEWVIGRLGAARLVTFDRDVTTREPTIEVAHEALLREWPRLVEWLREDIETLKAIDAIAVAATSWENAGRAPTDLYRGGRLETALGLATTAPDRLRRLDQEFVDASRAAAEVERDTEQRRLRRLRRLVAAVGAALVVALVAGGLALLAQRRAEQEAATALAATERAELATLISTSAALRSENPDVSILLALEAHRRSPGPETAQAVFNALGSSVIPNRVSNLDPIFGASLDCRTAGTTNAASTEFSIVPGQALISRDMLTGTITEHGAPPAPCVRWLGEGTAGYQVAGTVDGTTVWIGPFGGPWDVEKSFEEATYVLNNAFGATDRVAVVTFPDDGPDFVTLLDVETGEPVGDPISGGNQIVSDVVSVDGSLLAVSFGTLGGEGPDGTTLVVDVATGEERFRFSSPQPAAALAFDSATDELVAAIFPRTIMTVDLETGAVVSTVEATTTSDFLDIGVRTDGLLLAVTSGQAQLLDRRSGPVGTSIELRDVLFAFVRPDGTLFTVSSNDERVGVIDLEGNALVARTLPIPPFAKTTFNAGLVSTIEPPNGNVAEVIDLTTGERSVTELVTSDGEDLHAHSVHPEPDGLWAFGFDNVIGRWVDGQLVEELDLGGSYVTGTRYLDLYAYLWADDAGDEQASLIDLSTHSPNVLFTVPAPAAATVHPTRDGGMFVLDEDGTLHTYDSSGEVDGKHETDATESSLNALDPTSGRLAVSSRGGVVSIIDPETGDTQTLPVIETISNLGFGRDGELLALTGLDGTVRLWDIERQASAGVAWHGSGAQGGSPSWYDEDTGSIWVAAGDTLLEVPLDPQHWVERACEVIGRELTAAEWERFVPGGNPQRAACS